MCSSCLCVCDRHFCVHFHECSGLFSISNSRFNCFLFAHLQFVNFAVSHLLKNIEQVSSSTVVLGGLNCARVLSVCVTVRVCGVEFVGVSCVFAVMLVFASSTFLPRAFTSGHLVCGVERLCVRVCVCVEDRVCVRVVICV